MYCFMIPMFMVFGIEEDLEGAEGAESPHPIDSFSTEMNHVYGERERGRDLAIF